MLLMGSNRIRAQNHLVRKRTLHHLPQMVHGCVFIYELSGCGFQSRFYHLNFRHPACFEQGVP